MDAPSPEMVVDLLTKARMEDIHGCWETPQVSHGGDYSESAHGIYYRRTIIGVERGRSFSIDDKNVAHVSRDRESPFCFAVVGSERMGLRDWRATSLIPGSTYETNFLSMLRPKVYSPEDGMVVPVYYAGKWLADDGPWRRVMVEVLDMVAAEIPNAAEARKAREREEARKREQEFNERLAKAREVMSRV